MEVERKNNQIIATISRDETLALQAGNPVYGDRPGVTIPDAKFDFFPMKHIDPNDLAGDIYSDDRLERALKASMRAQLDSDGDIRVFVPAIKLVDVRVATSDIPRDSIETSNPELLNMIPKDGIRVIFGGSLKAVHITDYFS